MVLIGINICILFVIILVHFDCLKNRRFTKNTAGEYTLYVIDHPTEGDSLILAFGSVIANILGITVWT